jgi:hypothetical protein
MPLDSDQSRRSRRYVHIGADRISLYSRRLCELQFHYIHFAHSIHRRKCTERVDHASKEPRDRRGASENRLWHKRAMIMEREKKESGALERGEWPSRSTYKLWMNEVDKHGL